MAIQNNPLSLALSGVKWLPVSMAAQAVTVGAGLLAGWVTWDAVKDAFAPIEECPLQSVEGRQWLAADIIDKSSHPCFEEWVVREIFQYQLLKAIPSWMLGKIVPGSEWILDTTILKTTRAVLSGGMFSFLHHLFHPVNVSKEIRKALNFRLLSTLGGGIAIAAVRERTGSTWPALGLHIAWNVFYSLGTNLYPCFMPNGAKEIADNMSDNQGRCRSERATPFNHQLVRYQPSCPKENQRLIDAALAKESLADRNKMRAQELAAGARELASMATKIVPEETINCIIGDV